MEHPVRYRKLDQNGDYVMGRGPAEFLVDSPAAVAQSVLTTLKLFAGEWFLDKTVGVPWLTDVVGFNNPLVYDSIIQQAILGAVGVKSIIHYSSTRDNQRRLTVDVTIDTIFGITTITGMVVPSGFGLMGFGEGGFGE